MIEPSARTHVDDRTLMQAIVEAVDVAGRRWQRRRAGISAGASERYAKRRALRKHHPAGAEILTLYARLSAEGQQRVFQPTSRARRIVARYQCGRDTLTVPASLCRRYRLARVKRYSYRNKVEQLQASQFTAAANQARRPRGSVADGVCIRLYGEDDYAKRRRSPIRKCSAHRSQLSSCA